MDLSGKVMAITGASSGIGEATALAAAQAGAAVALGARRKDRVDELAERITGEGGTAVALEVDVADEEQARGFVRQARGQLGRLDVLVNNAGVMLLGPVNGADTDEWRQMFDVNVLGLMYATHEALPAMRDQGTGHVINVSSVAGRRAGAGTGAYNATKFAVNAFSEALRQEEGGHGIRVTLIEPGYVETELQQHNERQPEVMQGINAMRDRIGEVLQPDDIARAIVSAAAQPQHVLVNEVLILPTNQQQ